MHIHRKIITSTTRGSDTKSLVVGRQIVPGSYNYKMCISAHTCDLHRACACRLVMQQVIVVIIANLSPPPPFSGSCPILLLLGSHVMAYPQLAKKGRFWIFKIINNAQRHQQQRLAHSESTIFLLMVWHSESGDPEMKLVVVY